MNPHPLSAFCCPTCCERFTRALDDAGQRAVCGSCTVTGLQLRFRRVSESQVLVEWNPIAEPMPPASMAVH
jgi:hypothetical protein